MRSAVPSILACLGLMATWNAAGAPPAITVYNQNFAVVRQTIPLELQKGVNRVTFADTTVYLEPDSVMLRDPAGKWALQILEQNYRADPVSQGLLLSLNEGREITFLAPKEGGGQEMVRGTVVRSGYTPSSAAMMGRYGQEYRFLQMGGAPSRGSEPIVEIGGQLRFGLPGTPLFPSLADDTVLKPALTWVLDSGRAGRLDAELGYITGGMSWEASYNFVAPEKADKLDLVGWVTVDNQSGKTFEDARLKLMAGDVSKLVRVPGMGGYGGGDINNFSSIMGPPPRVTQKPFDEYHLYTVERATTLRDRETKQIEFLRAAGIASERFYVYDGVRIDPQRFQGYGTQQLLQAAEYGSDSQTQVWVMREIANTRRNHLGVPLPAGRTRFYQRDEGGQLEFTGENTIQHTPADEPFRVYTGTAFDLVGNRKRTSFKCEYNEKWVDESFEITLRNRKTEPVEVRVVEHLYRGVNWEIRKNSEPFTVSDSQTVEFRITAPAGEERKLTYEAHYTW